MQGEMVPVVLIPRFTSFRAGSDYDTAPLDVTAYDRLVVMVGFSAQTGTDPSFTFQDSHDGVTWFTLDTVTSSPTEVRVDLTRRWLRVYVELSADVVTCWCAGSLRRRVD